MAPARLSSLSPRRSGRGRGVDFGLITRVPEVATIWWDPHPFAHQIMIRVRLLAACLVLLLTQSLSITATQAAGPNVVLIVADDLGWSDLGCYGSDLHQTPRLDALAAQSVRFSNAYAASPVCTPTRASILTGKHPARLQMTIWRESALQRGNRKLLQPVTRGDLPLEELTLAEVLRDAGYYTAHIGKWHLGRAESYPQPHGFNVNIGGTLWGAPQTFFYPFRGDQYFRDWRYVPDLEPGTAGDYLTDRLTDKALSIIEQHRDQPFFINLWYHAVHTPIEGKPELVDKYEAKIADSDRHRNPDYAAMVETLDANVGRVLDKLDELGLAENTLVIFFSDNGGFVNPCKLHPGRPVTNNAPLRSGKGSCYEGGIRVPLIVRMPRESNQGRVVDTPVTSCDLFPTILSLLGLSEQVRQPIDGVDISEVISSGSSVTRDLFFHYPHYYPTTTPVSAIRSGRWKLLHYYEDDRTELYDLESDLGEQANLSETRAEIAGRLQMKLDAWLASVEAQMPEPNPDRSGDR
jgi:arylsulfatase A